MDRTLYVTDLDGTLLDPSGKLPAADGAALEALVRERGILLTYATARSHGRASAVAGTSIWRLPVIVHNGAFTVGPVTGEPVRSQLIPAPDVAAILEATRRKALSPLVFGLRGGLDRIQWVEGTETGGLRRFLADRPGDRRLSPVPGWDHLAAEGVFYLVVIGDTEPMTSFAAELRAHTGASVNLTPDTYHPQDLWLEVVPPGASKAAEALVLREALGADRIVCFGDNHNDLPLFAVADEAYAVGNATEAVLGAATGVIGTNADSGVVRWLTENAG